MTREEIEQQAEAATERVAKIVAKAVNQLQEFMPSNESTCKTLDKMLEADMWGKFAVHSWRERALA